MSDCSHRTLLKLEHAQLSDLGMRRANNQDALASVVTGDLDVWRRRGHLLMVADGMGAHAAGELASKLAIDNIPHAYYKSAATSAATALRAAIKEANDIINNKGQSSIDFQGMGTTCTCLALLPQGALVAHVGDSRAYRYRDGKLEQLSFDHSLVWEASLAGNISDKKLISVLPKNVITRSLGPHPKVNIDLEGPFDIAEGDVFLVCSDGLSGQLSDEEMGTVVACIAPEDAAQTMVDLANLRGGPDNISVVIARVEDPKSESETTPPSRSFGESITPANWVAMAVTLAALAISLSISQHFLATISALALGASVALAAVRSMSNPREEPIGRLGGPFGNGPYREYDCQPGKEVAGSLADVARELRNLADMEEWLDDVDWQAIESLQSSAANASDAKNFSHAVADYASSIRLAMRQLRERRANLTTQTGVDLSELRKRAT